MTLKISVFKLRTKHELVDHLAVPSDFLFDKAISQGQKHTFYTISQKRYKGKKKANLDRVAGFHL